MLQLKILTFELFLANLLLFLRILISIAISLIWRLRILKVSHIYPHSWVMCTCLPLPHMWEPNHCLITLGFWHNLFRQARIDLVLTKNICNMMIISYKGLESSIKGKTLWQIDSHIALDCEIREILKIFRINGGC